MHIQPRQGIGNLQFLPLQQSNCVSILGACLVSQQCLKLGVAAHQPRRSRVM